MMGYSKHDILMRIFPLLLDGLQTPIGVGLEDLGDFWDCKGALGVDFCMWVDVPLMIA